MKTLYYIKRNFSYSILFFMIGCLYSSEGGRGFIDYGGKPLGNGDSEGKQSTINY
jgi:hypothetical protein